MVQLLAGEKGSGKTKILLEKANSAAAVTDGNIVFLDQDNSHMYELKNSIRLVNVSDYGVCGADEFAGFVAGIISADHDLAELYIDRFARIAGPDFEKALIKINGLTEKYGIKCTASASVSRDTLCDEVKAMIIE
ncbi:MAG: twitching motility protein PilT [Lachnospiraceae bacterium]|nr:twitching motility protein PilT [Lachnospiraceae bacterium]